MSQPHPRTMTVVPTNEWKQIVKTVKVITSQISTLSKDKPTNKLRTCPSSKHSLKPNNKTLHTQKSKETLRKCSHEEKKSSHQKQCFYLKEYQKLKKKNQTLAIEKATLEKIIFNTNAINTPLKQKQNQHFFSSKPIKIPLSTKQPLKLKECLNPSKRQPLRVEQSLSRSSLKLFSDKRTNLEGSQTEQLDTSMTNRREKEYNKLEKQFNILLKLSRVEKSNVKKKAIRREMQEIAKKLKAYKS